MLEEILAVEEETSEDSEEKLTNFVLFIVIGWARLHRRRFATSVALEALFRGYGRATAWSGTALAAQ